jgi:hypothetical protein
MMRAVMSILSIAFGLRQRAQGLAKSTPRGVTRKLTLRPPVEGRQGPINGSIKPQKTAG